MFFEIGGKWPYSCCFVGYASRICSKQHAAFLCSSHLAFSLCILLTFMWFIHTLVPTQPQLTQKSRFILSGKSDFHMIDNLLIAFHAFARNMFTLLSVDEILLPRYVNLSTNFRGLPLRKEMAPSRLKQLNSVLFVFMWRPMVPAACCRLCNRDSARPSVFTRSARSSA